MAFSKRLVSNRFNGCRFEMGNGLSAEKCKTSGELIIRGFLWFELFRMIFKLFSVLL